MISISLQLPDTPGVYFFKRGSDILYIGKATSLTDRVRSYFSSDLITARGTWIVQMVQEADSIDYVQTDSVLEALLLEAALIKKYQPLYNTKEKSDKSFNYVVITKEEYPRVFTVREKELLTKEYPLLAWYGPFPHGTQLRIALKIIRKIFPYRGKNDAPVDKQRKRISHLYEEIGLAPRLSQAQSKKEYQRTIRHLRLFFEGRKKDLMTILKREMNTSVKEREFERADTAKRQLFALQHINDVALIRNTKTENPGDSIIRIEGYDIAHMSGTHRVGVMTVVENGESQNAEYRMFKIKSQESKGDTGALQEVLRRRLGHPEWHYPRIIVVDGGIAQKRAAEKILEEYGYQIPVIAVLKNEYHKPKRLLGNKVLAQKYEQSLLLVNSEAHRFALKFHRNKRSLF